MIVVAAAFFPEPAQGADRRVSLSYKMDMNLTISAPRAYRMPSLTPASLINNDYRQVLLSSGAWFYASGLDVQVDESGWRFLKVDRNTVNIEPRYSWYGNELGFRADLWTANRYFICTYKARY